MASVLIVDDSPKESCQLAHMLLKGGFRDLTIAKSATQAFHYLGMQSPERNSPFDLIFMDLVMQEVNGIETCIMIKAAEHLRDIPIVMVTEPQEISHVEMALAAVEMAFAAGAIDYLLRPVHETELLARARSLLRLKQEVEKRKERERQLVDLSRKLKRLNAELERLTIQDPLTKIANRRLFERRLGQEHRRMQREKKPLSLVMCDVDFFKKYNDSYGHMAGDTCLRAVARAIDASARRPADLPARYGGEEFALILPDTGPVGALAVGEMVRHNIARLAIPHPASGVGPTLTVSVGVATGLPVSEFSPGDLVDLADRALYCAKEEGRNRIETRILNPEK